MGMDWTKFRGCAELATQQGVRFVVVKHNETCTDEFCEKIITSLALAVFSLHESVVAHDQANPGHGIIVSWEYKNWSSWEHAFISKERDNYVTPFPAADVALYPVDEVRMLLRCVDIA